MKNTLLSITFLFMSVLAQAQTWQTLDSLGQLLAKQQRFNEADSVLQLALQKVEQQHGKDTSYAKVAYNLGSALFFAGLYHEAEPLWLEANNIRKKYFGKKHALYVQSCSALGMLYKAQGLYSRAEPLYLEVKKILEETVGTKHQGYAQSCNNLANLYIEQGLYDKAEPLYLEAQNIKEDIFGKKTPEYARSCNNLANLYHQQGFYDKAEPLYLEAKSIREETLGPTHPDYASSCNNLANLYIDQGLYAKAELLYLEAKNNRELVLGKKHPDYAASCNNLALLYNKQGIYDKAELLYLEAKTIKQNILGKNHPSYASSCHNLAMLYLNQGFYSKAEPMLMEAKTVQETVLGKKHPDYAQSCNNLALLYKSLEDYEKSEYLFLEAKDIRKEILGKRHPSYATSCNNLADLYYKLGFYDKAEVLYDEAIQNKYEQIKVLFPILSEQEKQAYWQSIKVFFNSFSNFSRHYAVQKPAIMSKLCDQILFTKGIIFSSTQKMKNAILNSGDTLLIKQFNQWKKQRETYTKFYQLPIDEQKKKNLDLKNMKSQINDLERELSKKSSLFGQNVQVKHHKWQDVKEKLDKDAVVIEVIKTDSAYIALFITASTENYPEFYELTKASEMEKPYLTFYTNCIQFEIEDTISYRVFWKPIADKLFAINKKGFQKIYFSPDGVYHQISLNTLKNTQTGKFLLEETNIQLIGSSRDLLEMNKESKDLSQNAANYQAYLLGYPIYGRPGNLSSNYQDRDAAFSSMQSVIGMSGSVSLLPGTKKEVENVFGLFNQKKLKVNLLLAENATEEALKNLKSPTILHVATHGFFIPEISDKEVKSIQDAMNRNLLKNPFMRSGLLLAGCQKPNPEGEDGILTAEEVMNLTLDNTELVVLSACETGLGDIQAGEGVFGLQRAFQQAGAKSVLMSLWKVDDEATQTLMTEFYTALLKGQSKRQAFKTAQMNLKKRFPEPYYWGAFVMVGE